MGKWEVVHRAARRLRCLRWREHVQSQILAYLPPGRCFISRLTRQAALHVMRLAPDADCGESWRVEVQGKMKLRLPTRHSPHLQLLQNIIRHSIPSSQRSFPANLPQFLPYTTMVKSTKDSTRFTATGVWAHTKPGGRNTTLQFADPAPKNETPQQKVKRLREAANRAKMAQVTKWDVAYFYGRMGADMLHRATVYGIVFATGTILRISSSFDYADPMSTYAIDK